jgi:ubiquinone/menaquinone biosynthesis C-methylase UbiE
MSEYGNLRAIVDAYTEGGLHDKFDIPEADTLSDYERILISTHCPNKDAKILNIGCGAGRETFAMYLRGYKNVTGVDCTESLVASAKKRCENEGWNIEFHVAFAHKLPFQDNSYDVVTLFRNLYGHITPYAARLESLAEIHRILKPGGSVIMNAISIYTRLRYLIFIKLHNLLCLFYNPFKLEPGDKILKNAKSERKNPNALLPRSHWFSRHEIPRDAKAVGFNVIQATAANCILKDPTSNSPRVYARGPLIYVLSKPM